MYIVTFSNQGRRKQGRFITQGNESYGNFLPFFTGCAGEEKSVFRLIWAHLGSSGAEEQGSRGDLSRVRSLTVTFTFLHRVFRKGGKGDFPITCYHLLSSAAIRGCDGGYSALKSPARTTRCTVRHFRLQSSASLISVCSGGVPCESCLSA